MQQSINPVTAWTVYIQLQEVASGNPANGSSHLQDVLKNISSYKVEFALKISYVLVFIISVILYSVKGMVSLKGWYRFCLFQNLPNLTKKHIHHQHFTRVLKEVQWNLIRAFLLNLVHSM